MKKILLLVAVVILLTGCGNTTQQETTTTTEVETTTEITTEEEVTVDEEMSLEEALKGYSNYSKEYIEELYYNTIDKSVSYKEWKTIEDEIGLENRVMYILLRQYGILK